MMPLFKKAAIVGTGLIGGSLALGLKNKKIAAQIIGVSKHKSTLLLAKRKRIIDKGSQDIGIVRDADLVVLAAPVGTIISLAARLARIVRKDCIITDVGSTKQAIVDRFEKISPNFVGVHPLAGLEKRGLNYARADMFKDSWCVLTPTRNTSVMAQEKIKKMWVKLGARVVSLTAQKHDEILSLVSHLPHAVAFSLISAVPEKYFQFASGGLKDTTRIAASDSRLWVDIFLSNRSNILKAIDLLQGNLGDIRSAIRKKDRKALEKILKQAKRKRDKLL